MDNTMEDMWIWHLFVIMLGYSTIFIPGYVIIKYVKSRNFIDRADKGFFFSLLKLFVYGSERNDEIQAQKLNISAKKESTTLSNFLKLTFCFISLQATYLTWGVLQEKIMTKEYLNESGTSGKFKDSQFLVFVNRILAFILSGIYILLSSQPRHTSPLYKYSYCSFSNIMSSWCQYEALKYVSFPTQVLAKASKIIPTMLMGKIVSGNKYERYEYITAIFISVGMTLFLLGSSIDKDTQTVTTISGAVILIGYMAFDSFTSNWQGELFSTYKMSPVQMMCGVNLFSCLLTGVSLLQQGMFGESVAFMWKFPAFMWDCILLSICSACGQLTIYYTISNFGAVVFIIIMTIRQALAILLSCLVYDHPLTVYAIGGIVVVFGSIFMRIYCSFRLKQLKSRRVISGPSDVSKV